MKSDEIKMNTVIFYASTSDDLVESIKVLSEAIREREDTAHKLYFAPLMMNVYLLSMGCTDKDNKKHLIGNHEVIFIPNNRKETIERLEATKNVVAKKSCMCIVGDSDRKRKKLQKLIDWLLEKEEEIKL